MKWASSLSVASAANAAVAEALADLRARLEYQDPDLVVAFVSHQHANDYERVSAELCRAFPDALLVGCSAQAVIGAGGEAEGSPGLALSAAVLPGVDLHLIRVEPQTEPGAPDVDLGPLTGRERPGLVPQLILPSPTLR